MFRKIALASLAAVGFALVAAAPLQASPPLRHYHVQYRSSAWQERVFNSHSRAHQFEDLKRAQGYQVHVDHHGSHFHVRYRMLDWRTYRTVDCHDWAHELEDMLRARGFQARVIHH